MKSGKQSYILNTASNLLGICFIIITGIKITKLNTNTHTDEIAFLAALSFLASCILSYLSLRSEKREMFYEEIADYFFLGGLLTLTLAIALLGFNFV